MFKLRPGLKRLNGDKKYWAGKEYAGVPDSLIGYFVSDEVSAIVKEDEREPIIKEVIVPIFGAMTKEQLMKLNKAQLSILLVQYEKEIPKSATNAEMIDAILEVQETDEEGDPE